MSNVDFRKELADLKTGALSAAFVLNPPVSIERRIRQHLDLLYGAIYCCLETTMTSRQLRQNTERCAIVIGKPESSKRPIMPPVAKKFLK